MEPISLPSKQLRDKGLHEIFVVSILLKGVGALLETILGGMLLWTTSAVDFILALIHTELLNDPDGFFSSHFQNLIAPSHDAQVFGGLYLLTHGVVKLVLVAGILRDRIWAYPAAIAVFMIFVMYQLVRYLNTHSVWLLVLTVFDLVVMWLIYREYRAKLAHIVVLP